MNENPTGLKKFILIPSYSDVGIGWIVVYTYTAHIPVYFGKYVTQKLLEGSE